MITTIQLNESVKNSLDRMKSGKQTYEEVIVGMMHQIDEQKRRQRELLIEGCKEMAQESLKITKEFEATDAQLDWEWYEN